MTPSIVASVQYLLCQQMPCLSNEGPLSRASGWVCASRGIEVWTTKCAKGCETNGSSPLAGTASAAVYGPSRWCRSACQTGGGSGQGNRICHCEERAPSGERRSNPTESNRDCFASAEAPSLAMTGTGVPNAFAVLRPSIWLDTPSKPPYTTIVSVQHQVQRTCSRDFSGLLPQDTHRINLILWQKVRRT
jgi:hypothetical protein